MGRGGAWPPNSFAEWMVGQNFRSQKRTSPQGQSPILKVKLSEDEVSGDETLSISYPGRRRSGTAQRAAPAASSSSARKVRFNGDKPLKSALKKTVSPNDSSDTLVDTSDDDATITTDESSDIDDTDTSEDNVPIRRRRSKSSKINAALCKKEADSDSSAAKDALPHPTCQCDECVKGRKILKAVIKFEAKTKAAEKASKGKGKQKAERDEASSTEATETTETEADNSNEVDTTEAETTDDAVHPPKTEKKRKQKQKQRSPLQDNNEATPKVAEEPKKAVNKDAFRMPTYPKEMQPNFIMPPRAKVMRVEHAIESENDPKPNAFFDSTKGITRVYHGPMYGNHMGELYGNCNTNKVTAPGSGTPRMHGYPSNWNQQPQYPPWFLPGPPPGPYGSPTPAVNTQMPNNEVAMREAASKGLGLSGMPTVPTPVMVREETRSGEAQKAASQKAGSDKGSKNGAWGTADQGWGAGNDNNSKPISAPADPYPPQTDAYKDQVWNAGSTWEAGGGYSGSKKDGVASPANFVAFGNDDGKKFERHSNNSGSQKNGNGGGGNKWGQTDNNNNNNNGGGWGGGNNGWGGSRSNDGGGGDWGRNQGTMWDSGNNHGNGWTAQKNTGSNGSKQNTPIHGQSGFNSEQTNAWGGPPGSFPPSNHPSRAGSNAGGGDRWGTGAWENSGQNNNNNSFNGNGGPSNRASPNEKGAHPWASGHGPQKGSYAWSTQNTQEPGPTPYWQDVSNQATGPSHSGSWKNSGFAQNTGGKADQW